MTVESRFPPGLWAEVPSTLKRTINSAEVFRIGVHKVSGIQVHAENGYVKLMYSV